MRKLIPPMIPKELRSISNFEPIPLFAHAAFLLGLGVAGNLWFFNSLVLSDNLFFQICGYPLIVASTYIAGCGFYQFSILAHDGGHGNLNRNHRVSLLLGVIGSSLVPGFIGISYMASHWTHHKFTNTKLDPNALWLGHSKMDKLPRVIGFFVLASYMSYYFFLDSIKLLKGDEGVKIVGVKRHELIPLILFNYLLSAAVLCVYGLVLWFDPLVFSLAVLLPKLGYLFVAGSVFYLEHGDSELGPRSAWDHTHPFITLTQNYENYHLEHHLFPHVQRTKLYKVHKLLKEAGYFENNQCLIEPNLLKSIGVAFSSKYPIYEELMDYEEETHRTA